MKIDKIDTFELRCRVKYNTHPIDGRSDSYYDDIDISDCKDMESVLEAVSLSLLGHGHYILLDEVKTGISISLYYDKIEGDV